MAGALVGTRLPIGKGSPYPDDSPGGQSSRIGMTLAARARLSWSGCFFSALSLAFLKLLGTVYKNRNKTARVMTVSVNDQMKVRHQNHFG